MSFRLRLPLTTPCISHWFKQNVLCLVEATISSGAFLGEMSFISGNKSAASVVLEAGAKGIYRKKQDLQTLLEKDSTLKHEFCSLISSDLIFKIVQSNRQFPVS